VLTHRDAPWYEVDLEEMTTSAQMLDWIFQIRRKTWCTSEDAGDLLQLLDRLLHPQSSLCSGGTERGPIVVRDQIYKFLRNEE
jgi:hypothetical protein